MLPCTGDVALEAQSGHSQWADRVQGPALGFVAEAWGLDDDEGEGVEDSGLASDRGYEFADGAVRAGRAGKQPLHPRARRWAPGYDPDRASVASSSSSSSSAAGVAAADLDFYPPSLSTTTVAESMARHGGAVPGFDWEGDSAAWPGTGQGGAEGSLRSVLAFASGSEDGRLLVWSPVTGRVLSSAVVEEERTTALCAFPLQPGGRVCVAAGSAAGTVQVVDVGAAPARLAAQAFPAYAPIVALEALPLPPSKDGSAAGVGILVSHPAGESAPDATLLDVAGEGGHSDRPLRLSTAWTAPRTMLIGRAGAAVVALPGGADAPHPLVVAAPSLDGSEVYCCRVPAPHAGGAAPSESPAFERIQLHARGPRGSQEEEEQQEEVQGAVERPAAGLLDEERDWRQEERGVSEGGGMTVPLSPHATVDRSPGPAQLAARVGSSPGPEEAGGARRLSSSQGAGSLEAQEERGARPHLEDRADWEEDEGVPRRGPPRPTPHPAGSYEAAPTGAGRERGSPARSPARVQVRAEGPGLAPCREPGPWRPPAVEGPPVPLDPAFRRPERAAALARWDGSAEGHGVPPTAPIAVPSDGVSSSAVAATMQQLEDEGFDEAAARQEAARRVEQRLTGPVPAPAGRARYAGLPPVDPVAPEAVAPRRAKRRVDRGWKQRQQRPPHPSDLCVSPPPSPAGLPSATDMCRVAGSARSATRQCRCGSRRSRCWSRCWRTRAWRRVGTSWTTHGRRWRCSRGRRAPEERVCATAGRSRHWRKEEGRVPRE